MATNASSSTTNGVVNSDIPNELDLAFIIDATSSMSPYIKSAQQVCILIYENDQRFKKKYFVEYAKNYSRYYFK